MRAAIVVAGVVLAAGSAALGGIATGAIEIPSLVAEEDVPLEPLVPDDDGEDVALEPLVPTDEVGEEPEPEPLIPAGTDLADAYRVEIRNSYTAAHEIGIARDTQAGDEFYVGDLARVAGDRYEGELIAIASLEQDASGAMGYRCTITWTGRQAVRAIGVVRPADTLPSSMTEGDDVGGTYLPIYVTEPAGPVDWSDPDDDCGGVTSDWLPIGWSHPDSGSALGGVAPRLPPPGYGKVEERVEYEGPGILGPTSYVWVFTITPIAASEVRDLDSLADEAIEIPPLVDE